jgi:hypothetical protein
MRTAKLTANATPAMAAACRRLSASWLVKAPTAPKTAGLATMARAKKREEPAAKPTLEDWPITATKIEVTANRVHRPTPRPTKAWLAARDRVVDPESTSSQRPASSSPRSRRVAVSRPHAPPTRATVIGVFQTVKPATVSSARPGPTRAAAAELVPKVSANRTRSSGVG